MQRCNVGQRWMVLMGLVILCGCASQPAPGPDDRAVTEPASPADPAVQAYIQTMRDDLSRGKVGIINGVMQLNRDEAKVFWPIYQEYEAALFDLGDQRVDAIRDFASEQHNGTLDDNAASRLARAYFAFEHERLKLLETTHQRIAEQLSPVHAAQFTQIEHRVGTVIDLLIAAELPLIETHNP